MATALAISHESYYGIVIASRTKESHLSLWHDWHRVAWSSKGLHFHGWGLRKLMFFRSKSSANRASNVSGIVGWVEGQTQRNAPQQNGVSTLFWWFSYFWIFLGRCCCFSATRKPSGSWVTLCHPKMPSASRGCTCFKVWPNYRRNHFCDGPNKHGTAAQVTCLIPGGSQRCHELEWKHRNKTSKWTVCQKLVF